MTSFIFNASRGGKISWNIRIQFTKNISCIFTKRSKIREKLCAIRYTIKLTIIVIIVLINVEKKNTIARRISSLKKVNKSDQTISQLIGIDWNNKTKRNKRDWKKTIRNILAENPKNFHKIKSCLFIGFERIRNIVFHSISLNNSWLPTKRTPMSPKTSIIERPKSTITLSPSPMVSFPRANEKIINTQAKKTMRYKNLFRTISFKVFKAIFNIDG